ncbi:uncharacterized protein LOC119566301 isoform X6 [Chelonia mydas]|uniref:uncharacterized protein LOC119566301 isoform X6 n=1 Tax=Chelonia mydas TaxID=8469 RepID=UPI0018A2058B|nr:uncharacterized protein LOC119566301 isoform X6 [Chelonia mydas]XP_043404205.1 uncharacterized protein LOC119566301 isoform X6 [Chelonia mydas]
MFSGIATALRGVKIYTLERCRYTNLSPSVGSARWTDEFSKRPGYCLSGRWMPTRMGEALAHTASSLTRWLDKPVTALLGSDVLLTCSFPAAPCGAGTGRAAAGDLVLPGPGADGAGRHRGHHEEGGRVFAPELPRGNASLLLPRVTLAEQGPYRCSVHYGGQRGEGSVRLRVAGPEEQRGLLEPGLRILLWTLRGALLLAMALGGWSCYCSGRRRGQVRVSDPWTSFVALLWTLPLPPTASTPQPESRLSRNGITLSSNPQILFSSSTTGQGFLRLIFLS